MAAPKDHASKLLHSLAELQEQNQLCDITINVGGRAFHAHKAVLAACSSYFLTMFTSGFKESSQKEISIEGDAEIFEALLEFAYKGYMWDLLPNTACDILEMACYMQFTNTFELCSDYIIECYNSRSDKIPVGDALKISILAVNHDDKHIAKLVEASKKYMENNLQELKKSGVFLENACVDFLEEFLSREDLSNASEEEHVLDMVLGWLKYDWENRHTHAHRLLQKVRLGHVTAESLRKVDAEILEVPECKMLLDEVLQLKSSETPKATLSRQYPELFATRSTITVPVSSYVAGRFGGTWGNRRKTWYFQYYRASDHWMELNNMAALPHTAHYNSLVEVNGDLFAAGGMVAVAKLCRCGRKHNMEVDTDDDELMSRDDDWNTHDSYLFELLCHKKFYQYCLEDNAWTELPPMNVARRSFPMVHLDGFIYVISGSKRGLSEREEICLDMETCMRDVERYDMARKEWEVLAPLPVVAHNTLRRISAVAFRGKILVYGLYTTSDDDKYGLNVLFVYHPNTVKWQIALREEHDKGDINWYHYQPPALFVQQGVCYRIWYPIPPDTDTEKYLKSESMKTPAVNILEFKSQGDGDDNISVTIGQEIRQDHIGLPYGRLGAFRIGDEVFLDDNGCMYKTSITINKPYYRDSDVEDSYFLREYYEMSNSTYFTFDRKLLE